MLDNLKNISSFSQDLARKYQIDFAILPYYKILPWGMNANMHSYIFGIYYTVN